MTIPSLLLEQWWGKYSTSIGIIQVYSEEKIANSKAIKIQEMEVGVR